MILAHRRSESTLDVDALFIDPRDTVLDAAREVTRIHGLPDDWLNDRVRTVPHMPRQPDKRAITLYDSPSLVVTGASATHLLAMKVRAGRQSDETDIKNLLRQLDVRTMSEVREIHNALFPNNPLPPRQDANAAVLLRRILREGQKGRAAVVNGEKRRRRQQERTGDLDVRPLHRQELGGFVSDAEGCRIQRIHDCSRCNNRHGFSLSRKYSCVKARGEVGCLPSVLRVGSDVLD